jgi:hypothetical protein
MDLQYVYQELDDALNESEEIRKLQINPADIESEITKLELKYQNNYIRDTKIQLIARYIYLGRWLIQENPELGIKARERFQELFPEHFKRFMEKLKASAPSIRWSGCTLCKYHLGNECAKGLRPSKVSTRYLNRDYECSAFEAK